MHSSLSSTGLTGEGCAVPSGNLAPRGRVGAEYAGLGSSISIVQWTPLHVKWPSCRRGGADSGKDPDDARAS